MNPPPHTDDLTGPRLHGVQVNTEDADMAFEREQQNQERLMAALNDLKAVIRFEGGTVPLPTHDPQLLAASEIWNLRTAHGDLDLLYNPAGGGYDDLLAGSESVNVGGYPVLVASLDDIIRSKEIADRAKDHETLAQLRRYRDQQKLHRDGPGLSLDL